MTNLTAQAIVITYHLASRLMYVLGVGGALQRQRSWARAGGGDGEARFLRFRRMAAPILANDTLSFVVMCWWTRSDTVAHALGTPAVVVGTALMLLGVAVKAWATLAVGARAFYWHDFFCPPSRPAATLTGPYRFVKNPMYSLGYAHTYGLALLVGSLPGLALAAFDQTTMLLFHHWVERPHVESLYGNGRAVAAVSDARVP